MKKFLLVGFILICMIAGCGNKTEDKGITELSQLDGKTFGIPTGSAVDQLVGAKIPGSKFEYFNNTLDACMAVKNGSIDAAAMDEPVLRNIAAKNPGLYIIPEMITIDDYSYVVKHDNVSLKKTIDKVIAEKKADGTYDDMMKRWFPKEGDPAPMPDIPLTGNNGVLKVGTSASVEPFTFQDASNKIVGFDIEMASYVAQALGMQLEIVDMDFGSLIPAVASGKVDMLASCITVTEERKKKILFSDPYYKGGIAAIVKQAAVSDDYSFNGLQEIDGARIGVMTGATADDFMRKNYPQADIKSFDDIMDAVAALKSGQIDGVVTVITTSMVICKQNTDLDYLPEILKKEDACIAVAKNNTELLNKIDAILTEMKKDGTLDDIISRWVKKENVPYEPVEIEELKTGPVLKVAVCANREPTSFIGENGEFTGMDAEMAKRIALKLGMQVQFEDMKFGSLIAALQSGKADAIISTMSVTDERKKEVNFTQPYFNNNQVFIVRKLRGSEENESLVSKIKGSFYSNVIAEKRYMLIWDGLKTTVIISLLSVVLGTLLGALVCWLRMSRFKIVKTAAKAYITILRGIPIVVLLMISYYLVFASVDLNPVMVAVVAFGMNFAAYVSEMFRTSVESIDKGQWEAGIASGFTRIQTFRYIIMPQAIKNVLPVYTGEFISMVKMTSVVGYIAVQDLTKACDIIRSRTFEPFFPLIMLAVIYLCISWVLISALSVLAQKVDPKANRKQVKA